MSPKSTLTLTSHEIALTDDTGIGPELLCPRCGGNYLHHNRVTVFDRGEDDELTVITTVASGLNSSHMLPSDEVANPSGRRDGIAIAFWCEGCSGQIELTIAQHKGSTNLAWRFEPKKPDWKASA